MATLILTAAGNAIGGPIGGAIGSFIGQQIDSRIFAPKGRDGPRLKELEVQTSSYGSDVPAIFGAMRVAGTVIWATDLIERRTKSGGGKGRPSTSSYSYSVNFAVALSSRPVARVGRIWADGNLLRGAGGDFKSDTQFRFHQGHGDQPLDPLIASAESAGQCPAYRGLAYAVFEDFQLADYGNRIPSLTFEIFERDVPVPVHVIFSAASGTTVEGDSGEMLNGYAMSGADGRAALSPLLDSLPVSLRAKGDGLELIDWWHGADAAIPVVAAAKERNQSFDRPTTSLQPANAVPQSLKLRHYDPARDFQSGMQASQSGAAARTVRQIEIPAALSATAAKRIADLQLLQTQRARESWSADVMLSPEPLHAGAWVRDPGGRLWRIIEIEHRAGTAKITAIGSVAFDPTIAAAASPGRNLAAPDLSAGQTHIVIIDLPVFGTVDPARPQVAVFASGTGPGWRRAALSVQNGNELLDIGATALSATIGHLLDALPPHNPVLIDHAGVVDVQLLHDGMEIAGVDGTPLMPNAGLCWIEGEFVRFGSVEALGDGRYRLTKLLRGCHGSENAIAGHAVGDRLVLMELASARMLDEVPLATGATVSVEALGLGDSNPVVASALVAANAIAPLSPVHLQVERSADGNIYLGWIRRSRIDLGWNDSVDQILAEDVERYSIALLVDGQTVRQWTVATNEITIAASELVGPPFVGGATLTFQVRQIGRHMMSAPAISHFILPF